MDDKAYCKKMNDEAIEPEIGMITVCILSEEISDTTY